MVGNRPGLQKALEKAAKKGHSMWRSTNIEKETEPAPKDPNLKQVHQTVTEFHIVHLPSGQFNLYGHDISHILDLQKKAESANEAKSRFLSVMSHEIRTPLNAILGLTDLLTHDEPTRQQQLQHLAYMEFSGKHLLSLVNDILDLEKLAAGNVTGLPSLFNLIDLIQNIGESFQNRGRSNGSCMERQLRPQGAEDDLFRLQMVDSNPEQPDQQRHQIHPARIHKIECSAR